MQMAKISRCLQTWLCLTGSVITVFQILLVESSGNLMNVMLRLGCFINPQ